MEEGVAENLYFFLDLPLMENEWYLQQVLQLAALAAKAIEGPILSQAVDPFPPR